MKVIVTAGGTGGHIYPAIAIINKIKKEEPKSKILYIGSHNRMEKKLIPSLGIDYKEIKVTGFKRKLTLENIKTIYNFLNAKKKSQKIIKDFDPDIVIGTGGYVTAPVIWAASKLGKKTFIHEQNSTVGLANKFLTKYADKIGVSFENTIELFPKEKVVLTGNPCSENALEIKAISKEKYGLKAEKKLVIIVMGSLGSNSINEKIKDYLTKNNFDYEVLFVTGESLYDKVKKEKFPKNVKVVPYVINLPKIMKQADLIVTRAGASTISEIEALELPAIFIPSPYVTNNHQYKNAMYLSDKKAAITIEEKNLTSEILFKEIENLLNDEQKYLTIKNNLKNCGIKNSSKKIYELLKDLIMRDQKFY